MYSAAEAAANRMKETNKKKVLKDEKEEENELVVDGAYCFD